MTFIIVFALALSSINALLADNLSKLVSILPQPYRCQVLKAKLMARFVLILKLVLLLLPCLCFGGQPPANGTYQSGLALHLFNISIVVL